MEEEAAHSHQRGTRMAAIVSPAEKVKQFPTTPGVYLMKDAQGVVLYVGKAKNLRNRAGHYFTKAGAEDHRTADLVKLIADVDFVPADSEVDALLLEARLVKDVRPRFNVDLKDDKTFPYMQIRIREEFPRVEFTRTPRRRGVRLYGPFTSARTLAASHAGIATPLPVPHLFARHPLGRRPLALVPALPAAQHPPVYGPLQFPRDARGVPQTDPQTEAGDGRQEASADRRDGEGNAGGRAPRSCSRRRPGCATTWRR